MPVLQRWGVRFHCIVMLYNFVPQQLTRRYGWSWIDSLLRNNIIEPVTFRGISYYRLVNSIRNHGVPTNWERFYEMCLNVLENVELIDELFPPGTSERYHSRFQPIDSIVGS